MKILLVLSCLVAATLAQVYRQPEYYPVEPRIFDNSSLRVVDGQNAVRNQIPYQISLLWATMIAFRHICGGSIVSHRWVLSAAHCTAGSSPSMFRVHAGILFQSDSNIDNQQLVAVDRIINHPGYPGGVVVSADDIALIHLASPLNYGINVQPVPIAYPGEPARGFATLSGWGSVGPPTNASPNNLQFVILPISPQDECAALIASVSGSDNPFRPLLNVCTVPVSTSSSEGSCSGDSGGPLVHDGRLVGIVSWGYTPCGTWFLPSVFVKVAAYYDWIVITTKGEVH